MISSPVGRRKKERKNERKEKNEEIKNKEQVP